MRKLIAIFLLCALLLSGCAAKQSPPPAASGNLTVHFIDVGQADCALLSCDGKYMLIDGGNVGDSSLVVSYLQKQGVAELEAVVCTHAHEDHVGGLAGVLAVFPTKAVYAPTRTHSSNCFEDFVYYADQQDLTIRIPAPGDTLTLGDTQLSFLGPVKSYPDVNNTSLVLKAVFGETSFLFTGDMETDAENDMLDAGADVKVDVLKVGHHGSNTSTGHRFLYETDPDYAIISVGADNTYGHPHEEPMSRLNDAEVTVYRTDELGSILVSSDGKTLSFSWEKGSAAPSTPSAPSGETYYIGNKNSKVLHLPTCGGLPAEHNQVLLYDYTQAIADGYTPCSRCMG